MRQPLQLLCSARSHPLVFQSVGKDRGAMRSAVALLLLDLQVSARARQRRHRDALPPLLRWFAICFADVSFASLFGRSCSCASSAFLNPPALPASIGTSFDN